MGGTSPRGVMNKIHIIIPVFNGWPQTKVCLDALRASSYRDLEIIVVDHGSTDETKKALPAEYPEVVHLLGEPTLWWTGATNLGIRTATNRGAGTIMLLNNDCYVTPETIERLMAHGQRTRGGYHRSRSERLPVQACFVYHGHNLLFAWLPNGHTSMGCTGSPREGAVIANQPHPGWARSYYPCRRFPTCRHAG